MKILLDASALQEGGSGRQFWEELVVAMSKVVGRDELIVLARGLEATVSAHDGCKVIHVPHADRLRPALEADRLACLCERLGVDLFVGSYYTCPANDMVSLLFVYDMEPERFPTSYNGDDVLLIAKRMAIRSAHSFVVLTHAVGADLSAFYNIDPGQITCIPYLARPGGAGMENFARNLLVAGKCTASSPLSAAERERRSRFLHCLNQQVSCWQAFEFASHTIGKLLEHHYFYQAATMSKGVSDELSAQADYFDDALHRSKLPGGLLEQILLDKVEALEVEGEKESAVGLLQEINRAFPHNVAARALREKLGSY